MRFLASIVTLLIIPIVAVAIVMSLVVGGGITARLSGSIFTTGSDGGIVNENVHYGNKIDVYLDGGPGPNAPKPAAGLPDGNYYFQVTDPSGAVLLSEDPARCREIRVNGGVIVQLVSIGRTYGPNNTPCSVQDSPTPLYDPQVVKGVSGPGGRHDTNVDLDYGPPATVIQLMPFFDTPNNGGTYKVWIVPTIVYAENGGNAEAVPSPLEEHGGQIGYVRDPGFGPPRDQIKTDDFKVRVQPVESATATVTHVPTATNTTLPTATATDTPAPPTPTSTNTPATPTSTSTAVPPTATQTPSPSPTNTPLPTATMTSTPVPPTATQTPSPSPTDMPLPTATMTSTPVPPTATQTPSPSPTDTPLPTATMSSTPVPPTATPTPAQPGPTRTTTPTTATKTPAATYTARPKRSATPVSPTETRTPISEVATVAVTPVRTSTPQPRRLPTAGNGGVDGILWAGIGVTLVLLLIGGGLVAGARHSYKKRS